MGRDEWVGKLITGISYYCVGGRAVDAAAAFGAGLGMLALEAASGETLPVALTTAGISVVFFLAVLIPIQRWYVRRRTGGAR